MVFLVAVTQQWYHNTNTPSIVGTLLDRVLLAIAPISPFTVSRCL